MSGQGKAVQLLADTMAEIVGRDTEA